jgi:ribosomal protein L11 methylase PrmA
MYQLGPLVVIGQDEAAPDGWWVRLLPLVHVLSYPWWSDATEAVLAELAAVDLDGKAVLDFGCGDSAILSIAVAKRGATPHPVEINPEFVEIAQQQLAANGIDVLVSQAAALAHYDFALANVGDAELVGKVSLLADHGIGTDRDGNLIKW